MNLFSIPVFILFSVIALGAVVGSLKLRNTSLEAAGVFFVALVFGHFQCIIPREVTEIGLVLFVYSVGLRAGPRFFSILRRRGGALLGVGLGSTAVGAGTTVLLASVFGFAPAIAAGLYCGATTCTPALAAVLDAVGRALSPADRGAASVGYGIAYPFSLFCVVIAVQSLPRLFRVKAVDAARQYNAEQLASAPPLEVRAFRLTNPNCADCTIEEIQRLHLSAAVICRIKHDDEILPVQPDTVLRLNDIVRAVGTPIELAKLEAVFGDPVEAEVTNDPTGRVTSELVVVSRPEVYGKLLRELALWERFGVVVTRIRRDRVELSPHGNLAVEPGDVLRLVGAQANLDAVAALIGREERRLDETSIVPLAGGIALGAAAGLIPIPLPGELSTHLGTGGGAFVVGLILGYLGHVGPVRVYVPNAAKQLMRDLGLVIFLAGAGTAAGEKFIPILRAEGPQLLLAGAAVSLVTTATAVLLLGRVLRWNMLSCGGATSACMTNPAGLASASRLADSDAAAVAFASLYPVALIAKIILAQVILLIMRWQH